ncbi:MAG TPA: histidine phosphatase family protein [Bacillota bacterium]|nr:histidine phosphatase family protein [Bacillota bacterium]
MTTVLIVRHGVTDYNQQGIYQGRMDVPLNQLGEAQVAKLGSWLSGRYQIDKIYSSPLLRAQATAQAIAAGQAGAEIVFDEGLQEIDVGEWEGMSAPQAKEANPDVWNRLQVDQLYTRRPEGESYWDLYQRVSTCLDNIVSKHSGETLCVTSHGGCVRVMLAHVMGVPPTTFAFMSGLQVDNTGLTVVRHSTHSGRWQVLGINSLCHLQEIK